MKDTAFGLNGNQLKLIALITMTIDHIGMLLLPQYPILRIIGRLAFPIYAYMIAEGCRYTKNKKRYLGGMAGLALLCQLVYFFAQGSLYMSVLVTFSLSISLIYLADFARKKQGWAYVLPVAGVLTVWALTALRIPGTDYGIDYGLYGVLLPAMIFLGRSRAERLLQTAIWLCLLAQHYGGVQWYGLLAMIPLALYNGQRGRAKMKYLFYIYYPAHLVVLEGLRMLL